MEIFGVFLPRPLQIDEIQPLIEQVSKDRQLKIKRFRKAGDAWPGLIGEVLIRSIIRNKFNISNKEIVFSKGTHGKPFAAGIPSFYFNISHSGRWVVCAVDCVPVGIDIEEILPIDQEVAKYVCSGKEYQWLISKENHEQMAAFYDIWTMKESFVKWTGRGLSSPLSQFSLSRESKARVSNQLNNEVFSCTIKPLHLDPQYKMAVCSATKNIPDQIILKQVEELTV